MVTKIVSGACVPFSTSGARRSRQTTIRQPVDSSRSETSSATISGLIATTTPPAIHTPFSVVTYSGTFGSSTPTRSPCARPKSTSVRAMRADSTRISCHVSAWSKYRQATRCGKSRAAASSRPQAGQVA